MKLPQCEILPSTTAQEILFVTGGRAPDVNWFTNVADGRKIFCVDRGIEICRACNLVPEILIGDFDSANQTSVAWARTKKIPVERHPVDKDLTDTQLALNRAAELFGEHVALVTGCFGGRVDHLYSTIFTCAASSTKIFLADEREIIFFVTGGESIDVTFNRRPLALSLLPVSEICSGVTIKNVRWELDGATLTQNFPNAISNRVTGDEVSIGVEIGKLAVYLCFTDAATA